MWKTKILFPGHCTSPHLDLVACPSFSPLGTGDATRTIIYLGRMSRLYTASQLITHRIASRRWDAFHSPFLFRLFTHCCSRTGDSPFFEKIESRRKMLLQSQVEIERMDFGAGSMGKQGSGRQKIRTIARKALSAPFECRFLARLAGYLRASHILEFGTSLGISASYLQAGAPEAAIVTIEGDPAVTAMAAETFHSLGLNEIQLVNSTFDQYLLSHPSVSTPIDILFLDGHHISSALIEYFIKLKPRFTSETVVVVDDIYWSKDMHEGWLHLIREPEVTQSVDCFYFGLLFFKSEFFQKEHHLTHLPVLRV